MSRINREPEDLPDWKYPEVWLGVSRIPVMTETFSRIEGGDEVKQGAILKAFRALGIFFAQENEELSPRRKKE